MTKVVILAGGRGTRIGELTGETPKPMLMVGNKPILQHIIDNFVRGDFTDFLIPVGYLGGKIRSYFRTNYDFVEEHENYLSVKKDNINVSIIDTGIDTLTGGRLVRLKDKLTEPFMMTYGDGLSNINPKYVKEMGEELGKNIITVVHPVPRFGSVVLSPNAEILSFSEKTVNSNEWINGGFMYLYPDVLKYGILGDDCNFEKDILPKVVWESSLFAFRYEGIWHCIDTATDLEKANEMYKNGVFKW